MLCHPSIFLTFTTHQVILNTTLIPFAPRYIYNFLSDENELFIISSPRFNSSNILRSPLKPLLMIHLGKGTLGFFRPHRVGFSRHHRRWQHGGVRDPLRTQRGRRLCSLAGGLAMGWDGEMWVDHEHYGEQTKHFWWFVGMVDPTAVLTLHIIQSYTTRW